MPFREPPRRGGSCSTAISSTGRGIAPGPGACGTWGLDSGEVFGEVHGEIVDKVGVEQKDAKKREEGGAFCTPQPPVDYSSS